MIKGFLNDMWYLYPCDCNHGICEHSNEFMFCKDSLYGENCDENCTRDNGCLPSNSTNICISCDKGYYGNFCEKCLCDKGECIDNINGNGECITCNEGYIGKYCNTTCSCENGLCPGIYGIKNCLSCFQNFKGSYCEQR